jgi:hypothetical protein
MSDERKMTRLQAFDILHKYDEAFSSGEFRKACHLVGITDEMAEDMTHQEILQAMAVRLADIARAAGIIEEWLSEE